MTAMTADNTQQRVMPTTTAEKEDNAFFVVFHQLSELAVHQPFLYSMMVAYSFG
jgi:hypothetical protein